MEIIRDPLLQMEFRGNSEVIKTILSQAIDPQPDVKVALIMPGGVQRGVYLAGAVEVIHRLKATKGINYIRCNSSGAAAAMCLVAESEKARTTHFLENIQNKLIAAGRWIPFLDIQALSDTFEFKHKISAETIRASSTRLLVGLTDFKTGEPFFVDAGKTKDHPLRTVAKSMNWPYITNMPVSPDEEGRHPGDGWLGDPIPLDYDATHVLVLSPNPLSERLNPMKQITSGIAYLTERGLLPEVTRLISEFPTRFNARQNELVAYAEKGYQPNGAKFAVIAPIVAISPYSMNGPELRRAQSKSKIFVADQFRRFTA